jgi:hypothetical protein
VGVASDAREGTLPALCGLAHLVRWFDAGLVWSEGRVEIVQGGGNVWKVVQGYS